MNNINHKKQEQELNKLKNEIDRLREPPLEVAVIVDIIDKKKRICAVLISSGSILVVNASRKTEVYKLKRGMIVAVNRRTFAIMEILPVKLKKIKKYKNVFLPKMVKKREVDWKISKYFVYEVLHTLGKKNPELLQKYQETSLIPKEINLEEELKVLRAERKELMKDPLIVGIIVEVIDEREGKCVVMSSEGPLYVVRTISEVKINKKLESGMAVALNKRTFGIMEVLPITLEKLKDKRPY